MVQVVKYWVDSTLMLDIIYQGDSVQQAKAAIISNIFEVSEAEGQGPDVDFYSAAEAKFPEEMTWEDFLKVLNELNKPPFKKFFIQEYKNVNYEINDDDKMVFDSNIKKFEDLVKTRKEEEIQDRVDEIERLQMEIERLKGE